MNRLLESRQKRIELQEAQMKEMKEKNSSLQQQVDVLELKVMKDKQKVIKPKNSKTCLLRSYAFFIWLCNL